MATLAQKWPILDRENWLWLKKKKIAQWGFLGYPRVYRTRGGFLVKDRYFPPKARGRVGKTLLLYLFIVYCWLVLVNYERAAQDPDVLSGEVSALVMLSWTLIPFLLIALPFLWLLARRRLKSTRRYVIRNNGWCRIPRRKLGFLGYRWLPPDTKFGLKVEQHGLAVDEDRDAQEYYRSKPNASKRFPTDYRDASQLVLLLEDGSNWVVSGFERDRAGRRAALQREAVERALREMTELKPEQRTVPPSLLRVMLGLPVTLLRLPSRLVQALWQGLARLRGGRVVSSGSAASRGAAPVDDH